MSELPLTWMADAFRKQGLAVKETKGWKTRGRPGSFEPVGVMFHHTATPRTSGAAPALGVVTAGRADLPGPLCNVLVSRDGTVFLIAAGRTNHAGTGGPLRKVPADSGNMFFAGVEVENDGVGEPWTNDLLETLDVVFATMLLGLRRKAFWLVGHKEWAPGRKIDPGKLEMDEIRRRVKRHLRAVARGKEGPSRPETEPSRRPGRQPVPAGTYVVKSGDTLFAIAMQHHMSVSELKKINGLQGDIIHVGDKLTVREV